MDSEYMPIIILIAIILLLLYVYRNTIQQEIIPKIMPTAQRHLDKADLRDIFDRNFKQNDTINEYRPTRNVDPNMNKYYSDTNQIMNIIGTRGGNASFYTQQYEGFDTIDEQSCNEGGCNVTENIDGIFVSLENKMFPLKGKLTFSHRVNNDAFYTIDKPNNFDALLPIDTSAPDVLITNDMDNDVNANTEMNDLSGNVLPYGQMNDNWTPSSNNIIPKDTITLDNVNNILPDTSAISNNLLFNSNYPQRNYDNSMVTNAPGMISSNLGIVKKNIYHNGNDQVEVFRRIG